MEQLSEAIRTTVIDWTKPIEMHQRDGAVYQVTLIGFDGEHIAVVKRANYDQYLAFRKNDGTPKGGGSTFAPWIKNKMGV